MLKSAMELLYLQYRQCMEVVKNDKFYSYYAEEKIRHSLQVAGAGNYLVRHIEWLKNKSAEYVEMVCTAVLLHDVCRFSEIVKLYHNVSQYDHGVAAYEFLRHTPLFDDIRIRLPIKHHGHLIEALYADSEYQSLSDDLRDEVQKICFIVRDADKIANFNMVTHEPYFLPLFMDIDRELTAEDLAISDHVWQTAFEENTVPYPFHTVGDRVTSFLSWYMDINYRAALDYCDKLGVTDLMFAMYDKYCGDTAFKQKYVPFVKNYLQTHDFIK
ncbi:MAG: HD domain-containing protein [Alphaproteobacteria bacterium]|nr:HD domain-containing protein [Alphaproteobacteria bacterium]